MRRYHYAALFLLFMTIVPGCNKVHTLAPVSSGEAAVNRYMMSDHYMAINKELGEKVECHFDYDSDLGYFIYIGEHVSDGEFKAHTSRWDTILVKSDGSLWKNADETQLEDKWIIPIK